MTAESVRADQRFGTTRSHGVSGNTGEACSTLIVRAAVAPSGTADAVALVGDIDAFDDRGRMRAARLAALPEKLCGQLVWCAQVGRLVLGDAGGAARDELVGADLAQSEQVVAGREDVEAHDVRVVRAREPQHGEMWRTTLASSADAEQVLE